MDNLKELEELMIKYGGCIRAIPTITRERFEVRHFNDPDLCGPDIVKKEIIYQEDFKREMVVIERIPHHAGMFLFETGNITSAQIRFSGKKYYNTLAEVIEAIKENH